MVTLINIGTHSEWLILINIGTHSEWLTGWS